MTQIVTRQQLIPPPAPEAGATAAPATLGGAVYEFEPDEDEILADLLPRNLTVQIFRALLENAASFYGAQMTAMDNATRNAGDMIKKLTLQIQPLAPGLDHQGTDRDHLRRRGHLGRAPTAIEGKGYRHGHQQHRHDHPVMGAVVDVQFDGDLPAILNALHVEAPASRLSCSKSRSIWARTTVRTIAMDTTDGLVRGQKAVDTGSPITVPVGPETLGRILNVIGEPVDERGPVGNKLTAADPSQRAGLRRAVDRSRRSWSPASRSSTCWRPTPRAARSACSAAPASARP